jgi:hypothetical protein
MEELKELQKQAVKLRELEKFVLDLKQSKKEENIKEMERIDSLIPAGLDKKIEQVYKIVDESFKKEKQDDEPKEKIIPILSQILKELQTLTAIPKLKLSSEDDKQGWNGYWTPNVTGMKVNNSLATYSATLLRNPGTEKKTMYLVEAKIYWDEVEVNYPPTISISLPLNLPLAHSFYEITLSDQSWPLFQDIPKKQEKDPLVCWANMKLDFPFHSSSVLVKDLRMSLRYFSELQQVK